MASPVARKVNRAYRSSSAAIIGQPGTQKPSPQPRDCAGGLRCLLQKLATSVIFLFLSLYLSVMLEETARQVANSPNPVVPRRAKAIINFVGTGRVGTPVNTVQQQQQLIAPGGTNALKDWTHLKEAVRERVPVVIVTSHVPNDPFHPALVAIKQARKHNDPVWVIGPNPKLRHLVRLGVRIEGRFEYNKTLNWVLQHLGVAKIEFARLWFLHAFMHRHNLTRVFSISADVMLYANISELVTALYPETKVALPVRWPSMQPPPLPSQFTSTSVSAHAGLWHRDALDDFISLYRVIVELALFGGERGRPVGRKEYGEHIVLGWYTWSECWTNRKLDPPCMWEPGTGISPKLGTWLYRKTRYRPKFMVESLCQPRVCHTSSWSDEGLCVFDNSFSVSSPSKFFKFGPHDRLPQSKLYEHYNAWMGQTPRKNVQFLAVNFQGTRRDYLKLEDQDPSKTWGSAVF